MLFNDGTGLCPWHKADSSFKVVYSQAFVTPYYVSASTPAARVRDNAVRDGIEILECFFCKKSIMILEQTVRIPAEEVGGEANERKSRRMVSPIASPRPLHQSAPEAVGDLFREASVCERAGAWRAAGVMYRACVEELVREQAAVGATLYDKIESLRGKLSDELVADFHEARMLGNDSIHAGVTYSADEVDDVARLIEEAVLVLYVQPEQKRALRDARRARRRSAKA